ncbi:hypothetical protein bAD24_p01730 (plasmid) [Burkholderia sp. AD24]|nr:hypothetical protein bAD24_p01730 [Burkholderia sp. AD24]
MLFECVTRNCAFDLAAADRHHENHGPSVQRDGVRAIKNFHDVPRQYHSRSLYLYCAAQGLIYQKSKAAQSSMTQRSSFTRYLLSVTAGDAPARYFFSDRLRCDVKLVHPTA